MPPHAPTKDVTTTETITDKDSTITKVTRDHDELGQHTHTEEVDKVTPGGHTHIVATDVEKDDGEHVHKEVVDKDGSHGEHIHQVITETDKGERHMQKIVTDTIADGKLIHEEEKAVVNSTQLGDGTVKRVVKDRDEPGAHHHEEVTTIDKPTGTSTASHTVDDLVVNGMHIHEVSNTIAAGGSAKETHSVITDKESAEGHIHTEQVERLSDIKGDKRAVVDSKMVVESVKEKHVDVMHQEVSEVGGITTHHVESDKTIDGVIVHEVRDVISKDDGVQKRHIVITDKNIPQGHVHTEAMRETTTNDEGSKVVMDEKVVVEKGKHQTVDTTHKEATVRVSGVGLCATQHVINDRDVGGAHIHEELDTVQVAGGVAQVRTVVSNKPIPDGMIHTEKVEQTTVQEGVETTVTDEAVVIAKAGNVTVDVTHTETTEKEGKPDVKSLHHVETAKIEGGQTVHEVVDTVRVGEEVQTTEVIVTEEDHVYRETVKVTEANPGENTTVIDEVIVTDENVIHHSETLHEAHEE